MLITILFFQPNPYCINPLLRQYFISKMKIVIEETERQREKEYIYI